MRGISAGSVFNAERVPLTGGVILASNHASFLDPPLVGFGAAASESIISRGESLFRYPGLGWLLRKWNAVPVDRDGGGAAGLKAILDRLLAGGCDHFISRRHADEGRQIAARAVGHRVDGDQIRRAGDAGADVRNVRGVTDGTSNSPDRKASPVKYGPADDV